MHFLKMHGLGNDFAVFDARNAPFPMDAARARAIAGRKTGIGCDQVIVMEASARAEAFMRIYNADGSEVGACGNASRCVADILLREKAADCVRIETLAGMLECRRADGGHIIVDMGPARPDWRDIPLREAQDTLHLGIAAGELRDPIGVSMGNPHAVFFVPDADAVPLAELGPELEHHPLFPERANIGVAEVLNRHTLKLRVWERGAGETLACGTGACAAVVAAARRGLTDRLAQVRLPGGSLWIDWREDGRVHMTGPVAVSFCGEY